MANEIEITFNFENAPSAQGLGELFVAMSRDYRDMSKGRTLVVTKVASGSIIIMITDAALAAVPYVVGGVGVIAAINTIDKFAENLKKWFGKAKTHEGRNELKKKRKSPGQRSVEAIIKIAVASRSRVTVKHIEADGETIEAELTPTQAAEAQNSGAVLETNDRTAKKGQFSISSPQVQEAMRRLEVAGSQNLSDLDLQTIVDVIVAVLQAGGSGSLLPQIASEMSSRGLHSISEALRRRIQPGLEPPLATT